MRKLSSNKSRFIACAAIAPCPAAIIIWQFAGVTQPAEYKTRHARAHAMVDDDLSIRVQFRSELFGEAGVKNIAARGEDVIDLHACLAPENQRENFAAAMFHIFDPRRFDRNLIFTQPGRVLFIPARFLAVRDDDDGGRVVQHAKRVLDRFVIRATDRNSFSADAVTIAVFAEKHAVPEAFLHPGDVGWNVKNSCRDQEPRRTI